MTERMSRRSCQHEGNILQTQEILAIANVNAR